MQNREHNIFNMHDVYQQVHTMYSADCDIHGRWKLSTVLDVMQSTADRHNEILKCSRKYLADQGLVWVLFKTVIHMERYPQIGEQVTVRTYTKAPCMHFFPRYYELIFSDGQCAGRAGSFWVLFDIRTKKPVRPKEKNIFFPENSNAPALVDLLSRALEPEEGEKIISEYRPVCCDIDINGHVNNTRYVDWLYNLLGLDNIRKYAIESAIIEYNYETLPEHVLQNCLIHDGNLFSCKGYENNTVHFSITGTLKEKKRPDL